MDFTNLPSADGEQDYQIERQARSRELAQRRDAAGMRVPADHDSVNSPDGAVTVVVGPGGLLTDITFHPKTADLSHPQLRDSVLAAYRLGCEGAAAREFEGGSPGSQG
jgi:hypothetical protein